MVGDCPVQTTEWSPCSRECGWGIRERITNDNEDCEMKKETKLCQLKPCHHVTSIKTMLNVSVKFRSSGGYHSTWDKSGWPLGLPERLCGYLKGHILNSVYSADFGNTSCLMKLFQSNKYINKACLKTTRPKDPVTYTFSGCKSKRQYKPRYCGLCKDDRCCEPEETETVNVTFE